MGKKRFVSDGEMESAFADKNNRNVIYKVLQHYSGQLTEDELERCALHGLWKALGRHRPEFGQKFTTSLFRWVRWECRNEIKIQKTFYKNTVALDTLGDVPCKAQETAEQVRHVRECLQHMSREQAELLEDYFIQGLTIREICRRHGMSKEAARHRIDVAVRRASELCLDLATPVYSVPA